MKLKLFIAIILLCTPLAVSSAGKYYSLKFNLKTNDIECSSHIDPLWSTESQIGVGSNLIQLSVVDKNDEKYDIFNSVGCSLYEIYQTSSSYTISIYSFLGYIWTTECALEDMEKLDKSLADYKLEIKFEDDVISGKIKVLKSGIIHKSLPNLEKVSRNLSKYYEDLWLIIPNLLEIGYSGDKVLDLIEQIEQIEKQGLFKENQENPYHQIMSMYKFLLLHDGQELGLEELKEFGLITKEINNYYGN